MTRSLGTGTVAAQTITICPSAGGGVQRDRCYLGSLSNIPNGVLDGVSTSIANNDTDLKISDPTGTSTATIVFFGGAHNQGWYEQSYPGTVTTVINPAIQRRQRVIQNSWGATAWDTGTVGALALACRTATLLKAIHDDPTLYTPGTPFVVVGHSAGTSQIMYSMCHYGIHTFVDLCVLTAGPPHGRIDWGTAGTTDPTWAVLGPPLAMAGGTVSYGAPTETGIIDNAFGRTYCASGSIAGGIDNPGYSTSILRSDATLNFPQTLIKAYYGSRDLSVAPPMGRYLLRQLVQGYTETIVTQPVGHSHNDTPEDAGPLMNVDLAAAAFLH